MRLAAIVAHADGSKINDFLRMYRVSKLRLRYKKIGKSRYISHLDLSSTMRRGIIRAGIELTYSQGFNPHPYMSVALPLSVGMQSVCELMDIGVADGTQANNLPEKITACLPEGLEILEAYGATRKFSEIAFLEIGGIMYYDGGVSEAIVSELTKRFSLPSIEISKKTKRGESVIDIAEHIRDISFFKADESNAIEISAKLSAQNPTISPNNLLDALTGDYSRLLPDYAAFTRLEVFDINMNVFK